MKVVSLVPSLTELLLYLNVDVVGRTKFCVFPEEDVKQIPKIGGTKTADVSKIIDIKPDLVIANKEENNKDQVESISATGIEVLTTEISTYDDALKAILNIGNTVDRKEESRILVEKIQSKYSKLKQSNSSVCYLIWKAPYMTVGGDTYINDMLTKCGYQNVFKDKTRYPEVDLNEIKKASPDMVFLSSEPFPFSEKHLVDLQELLPLTTILLVDGTYFSWYGNRILEAAPYFNTLHIAKLNKM